MLNTILSTENLSYIEYQKYAKQIIIEEIGTEGQNRLKKARIACIGAGGINSPVLMYLAACGVGTIGIVDNDTVEVSNLQRQIIYNHKSINRKKEEVARDNLKLLNPLITVQSYNIKLKQDNIVDILSKYEIIIDGTDNFKTKYLIGQHCYTSHKIHIYGAIEKFIGQISVFNYRNCINYYDLYNEISHNQLQRCSNAGVINTVAGITGLLQATEVIKIITGIGQVACNKLKIFNLLNCSIDVARIKSRKLIGGEIRQKKNSKEVDRIKHISRRTIFNNTKKTYNIIDVRTKVEFQLYSLNNAINIPLNKLNTRQTLEYIKQLSLKYPTVIYCNNAARSRIASQILTNYSIKHYIFDHNIK